MYILLALIASAVCGVAIHYALPHRDLRGVAVVPATSTAAAAVLYAGLTWAGLGEANVWQWVLTIVASAVVGLAIGAVLGRTRAARDAAERAAAGLV
ncbi:hypothetical protein N8K70_07255 [Microbacterium betulae]|uniref:Uncharacterized protein n=1 Tax=Microbacterium betulae TaxID=2981139 RepID=A0AA97FLG6_9MICO|nr:hypothetical protein [Microbacterium sp. AB]WOF24455.1 hypothetical protein N8K70_07255 [Microbacterium sp. AB]